MLFAERTKDVALAQAALSQINLAFETMRDSGNASDAAYYEGELPKARAIGCAAARSVRLQDLPVAAQRCDPQYNREPLSG
jgi:hypothetical protein